MIWTYFTMSLFWDGLILLFVAGGGGLVWIGLKKRFWSKFRRVPLIVVGAAFSFTVLYGSFIESRMISITEERVSLPTVEKLTIVALSDFHVGPYKGRGFMQRLVQKVNALSPDLVLLAGDYTYHGSDPADHLAPLQELKARYGVFGVMGNHEYNCLSHRGKSSTYYGTFDGSNVVLRTLERLNVRMLNNESVEVPLEEGGPLFIAGIDDACSGHDNLESALPKTSQKSSVILLAHDPSVILDNRSSYANLIVSGHTHGGQIRLPFIGPLPALPTQLPRSYDQGIFPLDGNTTLAITRGVGETGPRARLFAPPEILVLRIKNQ